MPPPRKYREVEKRLRKHDARFQFEPDRGKGSERIIVHPDVRGHKRQTSVKHHGNNTELKQDVLRGIIRRFELPKGFFD